MASVNYTKAGLKVAQIINKDILVPVIMDFVKKSDNSYDDAIAAMVLQVIEKAIDDALAKQP